MEQKTNPRLYGTLIFVVAAWTFAGIGTGCPVSAGPTLQFGGGGGERVAVAEDENESETLEGKDLYVGGAPLRTDPDLMARLKVADQYKLDGNFRFASKLWQSVLGESGDILYTENNETYHALTERVESILGELPNNGLSAYRIAADASAREILAQRVSDNDVDMLTQVVKSYFMSSLGDDAAYRLGCIYLDRFDFVGAARLLRKITDQYPDPSVPLDDVWLRIAIAYTYVGDQKSAVNAMAKAREAGADESSRLFESVQALIQESPEFERASGAGGQWVTRLGGVKRTGVMPGLPTGYDEQNLKANWQYSFEPKESYTKDDYLGTTISKFDRDVIKGSVSNTESKLIKAWKKGLWRPAGNLLFNERFTVFKTGSDVTVWDRSQALGDKPVWRPLWLNKFAIDDASKMWKEMHDNYSRYGNSGGKSKKGPAQSFEIQLFGDQIAQAMSIHRGVLYSVEGKRYDWNGSPSRTNRQTSYNWGSVPRRTRTNQLTAYNMENGKIAWALPNVDLLEVPVSRDEAAPKANENINEEDDVFQDVGFMAAPVGFGDFLIVPVNVSGSIWIYALDSRKKGQLVWRSYLCDEPGGGSQPWSPIHLTIDGSTAYANCGTGVVFALDPMTGNIRFARRYERTGEPNNMMERFGGSVELLELDGWQEDLVIPYGNTLIVLASDYNAVWAIDRQTAEFQWMTENRPFGNKFDYLIGIEGDYIYIGGPHAVASISIKAQGRWEWVYSFADDKSCGRAMLTSDGVYVPLQEKIVKLALEDKDGAGTVLSEMQVDLGTSAPVGNLYSDGKQIWVVGGNRLYALGPDDGTTAPESDSGEPESGKSEDAGKESDGASESAESDPFKLSFHMGLIR